MEEIKLTREKLTRYVSNVFVLINLLSKRVKEVTLSSSITGKSDKEILYEVMKELEEGKIGPQLPGT